MLGPWGGPKAESNAVDKGSQLYGGSNITAVFAIPPWYAVLWDQPGVLGGLPSRTEIKLGLVAFFPQTRRMDS